MYCDAVAFAMIPSFPAARAASNAASISSAVDARRYGARRAAGAGHAIRSSRARRADHGSSITSAPPHATAS